MRRGCGITFAALALMFAICAPLSAQTAADTAKQPDVGTASAILLVDQDALYGHSVWGQRVEAEITAASAALTVENRKIEGDLTVEEKSLTTRRATMTPEAFRTEADAFDQKVVAIRAAQDAKARDINLRRDNERQAFFAAALPYFASLMHDRGAVAVLDKRTVFLSANSIDVTADLITLVNAELGPGPSPATPPATPPDAVAPNAPAPAP